jgi:hypothetical protein
VLDSWLWIKIETEYSMVEINKQDKEQAKALLGAALPVETLTQEDMSVVRGGLLRHKASNTDQTNSEPQINNGTVVKTTVKVLSL